MVAPSLDPAVGSLGQLLRARVTTIGDQDFLRFEGRAMTFASVNKGTDHRALCWEWSLRQAHSRQGGSRGQWRRCAAG